MWNVLFLIRHPVSKGGVRKSHGTGGEREQCAANFAAESRLAGFLAKVSKAVVCETHDATRLRKSNLNDRSVKDRSNQA